MNFRLANKADWHRLVPCEQNERLRARIAELEAERDALRALVKEAFCEGMMSAEGAPRPLSSDMESAWKHSESRELMGSF